MTHATTMPRIQRVPCGLHDEKVAAICSKCHDLAERQRDQQWARDRKEVHKEYQLEQARLRNHA
jgi:hypothetical protein